MVETFNAVEVILIMGENVETPTLKGNMGDAAVLFTVATFGCLGNFVILVSIVAVKKFRKSATAFIFHHCLLDLIKSVYCIPFGYGLLQNKEMPFCPVIGASYILLMMMTAYNLLALVVAEEYQLQDCKNLNGHHNQNHCCIMFGLLLIWFGAVLINLGVAFIPSKPKFDPNIGMCVLKYGEEGQFVLYVLWIFLVTAAVGTALVYFKKLYIKVSNRAKSQKWKYIHEAVSPGVAEQTEEPSEDYFNLDEQFNQTFRCNVKVHIRRILFYMTMVVSFILFWYPLFLLILVDLKYTASKGAYKALTIFAWTHPVTTPIFTFLILRDIMYNDQIQESVYSNLIPLKSKSKQKITKERAKPKYKATDMGVLNENFSQSSPQRRFSFIQSMEENNELLIGNTEQNHNRSPKPSLKQSRSPRLTRHFSFEV